MEVLLVGAGEAAVSVKMLKTSLDDEVGNEPDPVTSLKLKGTSDILVMSPDRPRSGADLGVKEPKSLDFQATLNTERTA